MPLKRTNVYAEPEDLAMIKKIAARRGVPQAEIIREGIRLAVDEQPGVGRRGLRLADVRGDR